MKIERMSWIRLSLGIPLFQLLDHLSGPPARPVFSKDKQLKQGITSTRGNRFRAAADAGLRVFPLQAGKKEPTGSWSHYRNSSPTDDLISAWDKSDLNLGVITGTPSGIVVLDADDQEAVDFLSTLNLPLTAMVRTARGIHYYFLHPGFQIQNSVHIGGRKLDVRGDGGYVVGAGSIHPSGARYEWVQSPSEVGFAELPPSLLELLKPARRRSLRSDEPACTSIMDSRFAPWLGEELEIAKATLSSALEGSRNDSLFAVGVRMAAHVAGADTEWEPFARELTRVAFEIGLTPQETEATLASCWKSGKDQPTAWLVTAREWIYLTKQDAYHHLQSGQYVTPKAFNTTFANQSVGKMGEFGRFLTHNNYVKIVHDLTFEPSNLEPYIERDGLLWLNTYRAPGIAPQAGDWSPMADFMAYLVPDENERAHLLRAMAWTILHPGKKLRHAIMIRSQRQGIGKSMLADIWSMMLGTSNVRKTTTEEISGAYQGFIPGTLLLVLEELAYGFGPSLYNRIKEYISGDKAIVNEKYLTPRSWDNYMSVLINTNLSIPMMIEKDDRRIYFIDTPAEPQHSAYYASFAAWWQSNPGILRSYFESIDLEGFNPSARPPMTEAKHLLIANSRSTLVRDLAMEIEERVGIFNRDVVTMDEIQRQCGGQNADQVQSPIETSASGVGRHQLRATAHTRKQSTSQPLDHS